MSLSDEETAHDPAAPRSSGRRRFMAAFGAFAVAVNFETGNVFAASASRSSVPFAPNAFIRFEPDGTVTILSGYLEMGQGTFTGVATLAAEELDVDWDKVKVVAAPADPVRYVNPIFAKAGAAKQGTGGSTAMAGAWTQMRHAGAVARAMLMQAAANRWQVDPRRLSVAGGVVTDPVTRKSAAYTALLGDAARLPVPTDVTVKQPSQFRLIGNTALPRVDVPPKVNGSAIFTQDVQLPGMLVAVIAHPPRLWGRVQQVDSHAAKAIKGVVAVLRVPGDDQIQGGVAVLAANSWIAKKGRDALKIDWAFDNIPRPSTDDIRKQFEDLAQSVGIVALARGKVDTTVPPGGARVDAQYFQPYLSHSAMEPMNCVVHLSDDGCEIWNGVQLPTNDQQAVAKELGIRPEQVKINQVYAGGSFGRRGNPRSDYVREAVRIARSARDQGIDAPIKMVWMREDDMGAGQYRPLTVHKATIVVDAQGAIQSWDHVTVGESFVPSKSASAVDPQLVEGITDMPYKLPNFRVSQHHPVGLGVPTQWLRSVGHTHTGFVGEAAIDSAARAIKKDPYAFRRALLAGQPRYLAVLDFAAEKSQWLEPLTSPDASVKRGRGMAVRRSFGTYVTEVAEISVFADGTFSVDRIVAAVDCGVAINPDVVVAQLEGAIGFGLGFLKQEITIEHGLVHQRNFNDYPVSRMNSMPRIEVYLVPSGEAPTGVGEVGVPPSVPAVINAIASVTGNEERTLPLRGALRML